MTAEVRAGSAFTGEYREAPATVWAAPGRVNLIGEHTDYNDGFVLPLALPHRTVVAASAVDSPEWTVWSEQRGGRVTFDLAAKVDGWPAYVAGVVWALREAGFPPPFARMAITSDIPAGAGLSSSAALECAVLGALDDLGRLGVPSARWPAIAQRAENAYVGVPCGIMDQSAATLTREGHVLFLDCRTRQVEHIPFDLPSHGLALLVIDTRAPHRLVSGEYAERRAACEAAAAKLGLPALRDATPDMVARLSTVEAHTVEARRARHVVTENQRVLDTVALLRAGKPGEIGPLLTESHASLRDDFEVTVPELDVAVDAALAAGALGARMTGGGFGGCVLALVDAEAAAGVAAAVASAFAARGFRAPAWFTAVASGGARRLAGPAGAAGPAGPAGPAGVGHVVDGHA